MSKKMIALVALVASTASWASSERLLWGRSDNYLNKYSLDSKVSYAKSRDYQLKPIENETDPQSASQRYQIYYKQIPVWGHQLIVHKRKQGADLVTGVEVSGIERDIPDMNARLTAVAVEQAIVIPLNETILYKNIEKTIYLDPQDKAHLAYHISLYTNAVAAPNYIVDANTGKILKQWDNLTRKKIGQGLGGNTLILPYRDGIFQHGSSQPNLPSLGKFDVTVKGRRCYLETPDIKIVNTDDTDLDKGSFPLLSFLEFYKNPPVFSYPCDEKSGYVNLHDGGSAPANFSFSVINDTMFFASITLEMYRKVYGVAHPLGNDLPLRAYTHIKKLDNAFAVPSIKLKGFYVLHQQIVIGDGDTMMTAPAQGTIAHELSHNVTRLFSNLVYVGQSGGINESFSDMATIAMQDYLRKDYPWYWDGVDWSIGREVTQGSMSLRYMDDPTKDGRSIGHAGDYTQDLDVHLSSGVFNKAFYLLANKTNWSVQKAFQVMVDANKKYWTPGATFESAACGVIQAAKDRSYNTRSVIEAFADVGVVCPLKSLST